MTTRQAEKPTQALIRKRIGEIPILQTVIQRLKFREILRSYIKPHGFDTVPAVDTLLVLVCNIACGRQPLYELPEWVAKLDNGLLGHAANVSCEALYGDDRSGRALNKLYAAREKRLQKAEVDLTELMGKLNARDLKTKEQIQQCVEKILQSYGVEAFYHTQMGEINQQWTKQIGKGRPGKNTGLSGFPNAFFLILAIHTTDSACGYKPLLLSFSFY